MMKTEVQNSSSAAYAEYERLLRELHDLERIGKDDSPEAEEIRDKMDGPYAQLTDDEVAAIKGLSESLYRDSERVAHGACRLSAGVTISGSISSRGQLTIDGQVDGEIVSDGELIVGPHARIHADIKSRSIIVYGDVEGNVFAGDRCELKETGVLHGDLKAARIVISEGATFIGASVVMAAGKLPPAKGVRTIVSAALRGAVA